MTGNPDLAITVDNDQVSLMSIRTRSSLILHRISFLNRSRSLLLKVIIDSILTILLQMGHGQIWFFEPMSLAAVDEEKKKIADERKRIADAEAAERKRLADIAEAERKRVADAAEAQRRLDLSRDPQPGTYYIYALESGSMLNLYGSSEVWGLRGEPPSQNKVNFHFTTSRLFFAICLAVHYKLLIERHAIHLHIQWHISQFFYGSSVRDRCQLPDNMQLLQERNPWEQCLRVSIGAAFNVNQLTHGRIGIPGGYITLGGQYDPTYWNYVGVLPVLQGN